MKDASGNNWRYSRRTLLGTIDDIHEGRICIGTIDDFIWEQFRWVSPGTRDNFMLDAASLDM